MSNPVETLPTVAATDRRSFLRTLGRGTLAGALLPVLPTALRAAPRVTQAVAPTGLGARAAGGFRDEPFWEAVKAEFPLRDGILPFNAANLCPSPIGVAEAVRAATRDIDEDASFQNRAKYDALRERVRARLAAYLGATEDEVAIVRNTTEANNAIVAGVALGAGDEVVLHAENHPSNAISWAVRAARDGFAIRTVAVQPAMSGDELVAAFAAALTPRTRVLSFTDVSNTTGIRLPARELCALARERGIHAHIDGAQSFGVLRVDVGALGCDSYAASAHKWFMGPKEAGVLYVRNAAASRIRPSIVGVGWGSSPENGPAGARRFETLGQRDDAVFAGLDAALDFHERIGRDAIEARVLALATMLKSEIARLPGASLVTPPAPERSGGVVIARVEAGDARTIFERLYAEHRIAGAATGGVRLCPHVYTTMADVQRAAAALAAVTASAG